MCGIAGCVAPAGSEPDRERLARAAAALAHRGPDDEGIEVIGNVGLVHRRLAIVDPGPAGHAPMATRSGDWWLTYNGEVFNHLALRGELGPREWRGGSDTETVLVALEAWGEGALPRFNGLFALAALDRPRGRLLLARDRFGVKPLYLAEHEGTLWFASELKALLAAGVPRRPARAALAHAARIGWVNGEATHLEGARKLLPGHLASVDLATGRVEQRAFYEPVEM
ncbi:MAG: Asparagine synthetase [glutamine-hydrolyzing], partial [uncultured Solirubrobacteraceae bacterium]